jgi:hypothetical protein
MSRRDVVAILVAILAAIALYLFMPHIAVPDCAYDRSAVDRLFGNCLERQR